MLPFILTVTDVTEQNYLEQLYNTHSGRMYSAAYKILENRQDAEDALQDTFIKIYNNIDKFMTLEGDNLILLIVIYTRNTARDILRRRNTALRHTVDSVNDTEDGFVYTDIADPNAYVEEIVINRETVDRTRSFIDSLSEPQRDVIIMKYRLGMREKEIAQALGISETAVSSRVLRAKDSLRKLMSGG